MLFFLTLMFISYVAVFRAEKNRKERGLFATLIEMKLLKGVSVRKSVEKVSTLRSIMKYFPLVQLLT